VPFASTSGTGSSAPSSLYKFHGTNWTLIFRGRPTLCWHRRRLGLWHRRDYEDRLRCVGHVGRRIFSATEALTSVQPHWTFDISGLEEMVNLAMAAPPPGAPYVPAQRSWRHGAVRPHVDHNLTDPSTAACSCRAEGLLQH
jgi:hypothetical protein